MPVGSILKSWKQTLEILENPKILEILDTHLFLCQTGKWIRQIMGVQDFRIFLGIGH